MSIVRGVDGCPAGWISIATSDDGVSPICSIFRDAAALFGEEDVELTTIDIPIGLPAAGTRSCDGAARRLIGPRGSSVFPAPSRTTLTASDYQSACAASIAACGKKISKQTHAITPKIREIDQALRVFDRAHSVFEVHPEVSFYFWNGRVPMRHPKRTGFGFAERFKLVDQQFVGAAERIRNEIDRADAADDDILDAFAALWTALRVRRVTAEKVVPDDQRDEFGLPMQIWA